MIGRGSVTQAVVFGSTAPGTSGRPGTGVFLQGGTIVCSVGVLFMSRKLTCASHRGGTDNPSTPGSRARSAAPPCGRLGGFCRTRRCCSQDYEGTRPARACRAEGRTDYRGAAVGSCQCVGDTSP